MKHSLKEQGEYKIENILEYIIQTLLTIQTLQVYSRWN